MSRLSPLDGGGSSLPELLDRSAALQSSTSTLSTLSVLPNVDAFPDPKRSAKLAPRTRLHRLRGLAALHVRDMVAREMELERASRGAPPVRRNPPRAAKAKLEAAFARARARATKNAVRYR